MKKIYLKSALRIKSLIWLNPLVLNLRKKSNALVLASIMCLSFVGTAFAQSVTYVQPVDLASSGATVDGSPVSFTENPFAMAFSTDGTKFYLGISNAVRQYTVGAPFDITAGLTYDEVYLNTFSQVRDVRGIAFSNDGMKLFVTGSFYDDVSQYSLSTAFDLSTASHEGTMQTLNISTAIDVDFSPDGMKMFVLGSSRLRINQYSLSTPFDITSGVTIDPYYDLPEEVSNAWSMEFDPYGNKLYVLDNTNQKVLQFDLSSAFDVSSGVTYEAEALDISNEEVGPLDIHISPDGSLFHVVGWGPSGVNEEINQYQINSGPDFFETDANLGSVEGAVRIEIAGDLFTNAGGSFEHKFQYRVAGYPSGLIPNLNISSDGSYATFTFTGTATNHQDINDVNQLDFTFVDAAFQSGNAAAVANASEADSDFGIDFSDNPTLSFSGSGFTETTDNLGAVEGSLTIEIEGETFANPGQELTYDTDYIIANVPDGLISHLTVSGDGLSAVLTYTGESSMHQNADDVSDIQFSFTNTVFQGGSAEIVIDADGASSNIGIDFNDNSPVLTHGYPYQIDNLTNKGSFVLSTEDDRPQGITFNADGTKMYITGYGSKAVHQYSLTNAYNVTDGVTYDNVSFDVSDEDIDPRDIAFNSTGTKMYMLGLNTQGFYQYSLSTPYDLSTMSHEGTLSIGVGFPMGFTFDETGNTLIIALAGVLREYSLTTAFDVTGSVSLEGSISILSTTDRIHGLEFNTDGSSLLVINYKNRSISKYYLTVPYDVLSGHTLADITYISAFISEGTTFGMAFDESGTRMFFLGGDNEAVFQLDMGAGGFVENAANDGSVSGEIVMQLYDDQFTNAGGTFIGGVEYIITNLPSGLDPLFSISGDGSTATLTFSGNATNHASVNDIYSLNISFLDAAFEIGDNSIVANNGNIEHGLGIDFGDGPVVDDATFSVLEGSVNFTVVGTVSATNPNMGTLSYSITDGNDLGKFAVQSDGDIIVAGDLDADIHSTFTLTIEVSDGHFIGSGTFTIEVEALDETAPLINTLSPINNSIEISNEANLVITFDEDVQKGTGLINVKRMGDDFLLQSFNISEAFASISTNTLTVDLPSALPYETEVYVEFGSGVILDLAGNSFGGLAKPDWSFTIEEAPDTTPPTITLFSPANGAVGVLNDTPIVLTFSEPIQLTGVGTINIKRVSNNASLHSIDPAGSEVMIDGNVVTITPDGGILSTEEEVQVYVNWSTTPFEDLAGNDFNDLFGDSDYRFTVDNDIDEVPPSPLTFSPEDEAINVSPSADLVIIFDEEVESTGQVRYARVKRKSNDEILMSMAMHDPAVTDVSGSTVTISLPSDMPESTELYIEIPASAIQDLEGNLYAGFADNETWDFTTADITPPTITSFSPANGAVSVANDEAIVLTFSEPIQQTNYGNDFIRIRRVSNGETFHQIEPEDATQVTIDGNVVTIQPTGGILDVEEEVQVYVHWTSTPFEDLAGNDFNDLFSASDYRFTVDNTPAYVEWTGTAWSNGSGPTSDDDVLISGLYTYFGNGAFECNDLIIASGEMLVVNVEGILEVNGDIENNGSIRITSGSSLITYEENTITGNDIEFRRITRYADGKYSFVGSPVEQNSSIVGSELGTSVYWYDETVAYGANEGLNRWKDASSAELVPGKGYTQAFKDELVFFGKPNTGTITYSGTYTEDTDDANEGWHLVSNPYAAAIFIDDFLDANMNTTDAIYIWDDNGSDTGRGSNNDYIVANKTAATDISGPDNEARWNFHIGSAQGFFVKLDGAEGDIVFTEDMRVSGFNSDDNFFRKAETQTPLVRINLTHPEGLIRQAIVGWNQSVSNTELAQGYDANVFNTSADYLIYTMKADAPLAIQTVNSDIQEIPVGFSVAEAGQYMLEFVMENIGADLYLYDKEVDQEVALTNGSYSFYSASGHFSDRFVLQTASKALALDHEKVNIYAFNKVLHIETTGSQPAQYRIFNLSGVSVMNASVTGSTQIDLGHLSNGVYIVSDGIESKKIIIK